MIGSNLRLIDLLSVAIFFGRHLPPHGQKTARQKRSASMYHSLSVTHWTLLLFS